MKLFRIIYKSAITGAEQVAFAHTIDIEDNELILDKRAVRTIAIGSKIEVITHKW